MVVGQCAVCGRDIEGQGREKSGMLFCEECRKRVVEEPRCLSADSSN